MATDLHILQAFTPITLEEMNSVKLMNRIDTKYVTSLSLLPHILLAAKDEYFINEINSQRIASYDTLYYDTSELDMYIRHHNRQLNRQKVRIRQYLATNQAFLEVKRKNNRGRTKKKRMELVVPADPAQQAAIATYVAAKSNYDWYTLLPQLRTAFQRITLVNKVKTERLTIDINLQWENIQTQQTAHYPNLLIIELKRAGNSQSPMQRILRDLRIHPMKMSKYCIGTALTNPNIKQNRFKRKIRTIEKLIL